MRRLFTLVSQDNVDGNRSNFGTFRDDNIEALCNIERIIPATELSVLLHIMVHVPDMVHRWNSVRNFWCFFGERCMGFFIRFIKNRDLAIENIVSTYTRATLILGSPHGLVLTTSTQLESIGMPVAKQSLMALAGQVCYRF